MSITINPNLVTRSITVDAQCFLAAWQFIDTDASRHYLRGVLIEKHPEGGALLVATNGHIMAVIHDKSASVAGDTGWTCLVPIAIRAALGKKNAHQLHFVDNTAFVTTKDWAEIYNDANRGSQTPAIVTECHTAIAWAPPIDCTPLSWRRTLPKLSTDRTGEIPLSGKYIGRITKAAKILSPEADKDLHFFTPPTPHSPVIVRTEKDDRFFALIMPVKSRDNNMAYPAWLPAPASAQAAAANDSTMDKTETAA